MSPKSIPWLLNILNDGSQQDAFWLDRSMGIFVITWKRVNQNSNNGTPIYVRWHIECKGQPSAARANNKELSRYKQKFRCLLNKQKNYLELLDDSEESRKYKLKDKPAKKCKGTSHSRKSSASTNSDVSPPPIQPEASLVPAPIIPTVVEEEEVTPEPAVSMKSINSDEVLEDVFSMQISWEQKKALAENNAVQPPQANVTVSPADPCGMLNLIDMAPIPLLNTASPQTDQETAAVCPLYNGVDPDNHLEQGDLLDEPEGQSMQNGDSFWDSLYQSLDMEKLSDTLKNWALS